MLAAPECSKICTFDNKNDGFRQIRGLKSRWGLAGALPGLLTRILDICLVSTADICPVLAADICPVSTEDIYPVSTGDATAAGRRPAAVMSSVSASVETG